MRELQALQHQIARWAKEQWGDNYNLETMFGILEREMAMLPRVTKDRPTEAETEYMAAMLLTLLVIADLRGVPLGKVASVRYLKQLMKAPPWVIEALEILGIEDTPTLTTIQFTDQPPQVFQQP